MTAFGGVYRDRRVLLTGHTGFKGSWMALWLQKLGADVTAFALDPGTTPSHWNLLNLSISDTRGDIRDYSALVSTLKSADPEIVFHLAAQPLVRRSYRDPIETWSTNVIGTVNVLEACRMQPGIKAVVVVTTDKCYLDQRWDWGYREIDRLGGHDPYSASKAAAELVVASYRNAFFGEGRGPLLCSVRAGNVVGGGDWSEDRLVPDQVRAVTDSKVLEIRYPNATRAWQHVLEPLSGYLLLGQRLLEGKKALADAWNFGPGPESNRRVSEVLEALRASWPKLEWRASASPQPHEATNLRLDSTKAATRLGWQPVWSFDDALAVTAKWYKAFAERGCILSETQLQAYVVEAKRRHISWADE